MRSEIPVVDLTGAFTGDAAARLYTGRQIDRNCTEIGLFTITGHGVPLDVICGLNRKAPALPLQEKQQAMAVDIKTPLLTILNGENVPGGLQVKTRSGAWIDVVTDPNTFVVNIGDLLMCWTNDRWVSNVHRVATPPGNAGGAKHPPTQLRRADRMRGALRPSQIYTGAVWRVPRSQIPAHPADGFFQRHGDLIALRQDAATSRR